MKTNNDFTIDDYNKIKSLCLLLTGIVLKEEKVAIICNKIKLRMDKLNIDTFEKYQRHLLITPSEPGEFIHLITNLSTHFFRESHHFLYLSQKVLPRLIKDQHKIRLWSAACSTGEEAYSLAMMLYETIPDIGRYDIKILATDINSKALEKAKLGIYPAREIKKLNLFRQKTWFSEFDKNTDSYQINDKIKKLISFRNLNLLAPWPMKGVFDIIMCRNLLIYFSADVTENLIKRFDEILVPGGILMVGHAESINFRHTKYTRLGDTTYKKPSKEVAL